VDINVDYLQKMVEGSEMLTEDEEGAKRLAEEAPCCYLFMSSKDIYPLEEKVKKVLMQDAR
jgi:UDP-N-acetylmuramate--alanine ligase